MYRIGIDVSGTFTDLVAVDDYGQVVLAKSASTPNDPSLGVMEGLELLAVELDKDLPALLNETERIIHGTTVATNALLERKGAKVGLLTTEGHRDILEMREGLKDDRYNLRMPPPIPLCHGPCASVYESACDSTEPWEFPSVVRPSPQASVNCCRPAWTRWRCAICMPIVTRAMSWRHVDTWKHVCQTRIFPSLPRSCRRSRNTSGYAQWWSMPMSAQRSRAI